MATKIAPATRRAAVEIGKRIRAAREKAGLSQEVLAKRVGMTRANYARLEYGVTNVTLDTLLRVSKGLELTLAVDFEEPER